MAVSATVLAKAASIARQKPRRDQRLKRMEDRQKRAELEAHGVDLFLHQQAIDTSTPSGRMLFSMLGVFAEFERAMIVSRVKAGLERTKAKGTRLGRPPMDEAKAKAIWALLNAGTGIRDTARQTGTGASTVQRIRASMMLRQETEAAA